MKLKGFLSNGPDESISQVHQFKNFCVQWISSALNLHSKWYINKLKRNLKILTIYLRHERAVCMPGTIWLIYAKGSSVSYIFIIHKSPQVWKCHLLLAVPKLCQGSSLLLYCRWPCERTTSAFGNFFTQRLDNCSAKFSGFPSYHFPRKDPIWGYSHRRSKSAITLLRCQNFAKALLFYFIVDGLTSERRLLLATFSPKG